MIEMISDAAVVESTETEAVGNSDGIVLPDTRPRKVSNGVTWSEKKKAAVSRVVIKIGQEAVDLIKLDWSALESGNGKKDQEKANEMIIALCNLKLSQIEILSILGCGSERISKMRTRIAQGDSFVGLGRKPPSHAFKGPTLKYLYDFMDQWETDTSVQCPTHEYKFFVEEGITWKLLHERYQECYNSLLPALRKEIEFMKYSTFTQYVHQRNPDLRLTKPKQSVCVACNSKNESAKEEVDVPLPATSSSAVRDTKDRLSADVYRPKLLKRKAAELEVEPHFLSDVSKPSHDSDSEDEQDASGCDASSNAPPPLDWLPVESAGRTSGAVSVASQIRATSASSVSSTLIP